MREGRACLDLGAQLAEGLARKADQGHVAEPDAVELRLHLRQPAVLPDLVGQHAGSPRETDRHAQLLLVDLAPDGGEMLGLLSRILDDLVDGRVLPDGQPHGLCRHAQGPVRFARRLVRVDPERGPGLHDPEEPLPPRHGLQTQGQPRRLVSQDRSEPAIDCDISHVVDDRVDVSSRTLKEEARGASRLLDDLADYPG